MKLSPSYCIRLFGSGLLCALAGSVHLLAEPPTLEYLYPAGFSRAATSEKVVISGKTEPWPVKAWVDHEGILVEPDEEKGRLNFKVGEQVPPGVYFLRLYNTDGASAVRPFLVGSLGEIVESEPNNRGTAAHSLDGPITVNGKLESSADVDQFRVKAKQGEILVASLMANNILASPMDSVLQICNKRGLVLAQNDDEQGIDPQLAFKVPADGEYLVRLFAFPETPNSTIGFASASTFVYRLTVTTRPFVDHVLPLSIARGESSNLQLQGWNLPADLNLPQQPADDNMRLVQPLATHPANPLLLAVVDAPSQVVTSTDVQEISLPVVVSGRVASARESHRLEFQATKGKPIVAKVESRALGFPMDPFLELSDSDGKVVASADDEGKNRDTVLTFNPPEDGTYTLVVRDLHRGGGFRYVYRLTISQPEPDFTLSLAADNVTLKSGAELDVEVTVNRLQGFKEEIAVTVEGLPEGVTADAVTSAPTGDSAKKVTLKLRGSGAAWSGAIRIVGQAGELKRAALYPVAKTMLQREDPWLTVTAAEAE